MQPRVNPPRITVELTMPKREALTTINKQLVRRVLDNYGDGIALRSSVASSIAVEYIPHNGIRITAALKGDFPRKVRQSLFVTTVSETLRREYGALEAKGALALK